MWPIIVGTLMRIVGRWRRICANRASAVQRSGKRIEVPPTEKGKSRFDPVA
jgi:hypothetical protein